MVRKERRRHRPDGGQRLVPVVGRLHRHQIQPDPLGRHPQHPRHPHRIAGIGAKDQQLPAKPIQKPLILRIIRSAMRLIQGTALRLAPEGAPRGQPVRRADRRGKIRRDQRGDPIRRMRPRHGQRRLPIGAILVRQMIQRRCQQLFLRLEMEIRQAMRQPRPPRHLAQRGARKAVLGDHRNRRLDQLQPPLLAAQLAARQDCRIGDVVHRNSLQGFFGPVDSRSQLENKAFPTPPSF